MADYTDEEKQAKKCSNCGGTGRVRVYHEECSYEYHYEDCPNCSKPKES
jgi:DnaJ-class molecular chaperone